MKSWDQPKNPRWDETEYIFVFWWKYYAIFKNDNNPVMKYYLEKKLE